jgi:hypothetical protein
VNTKQNWIVTVIFWFWVILIVPWVLFLPLAAMDFDGGYTLEAYVFFCSVASYPATVLISGVMRKRTPGLVFLPVLNFFVALTSGIFHNKP